MHEYQVNRTERVLLCNLRQLADHLLTGFCCSHHKIYDLLDPDDLANQLILNRAKLTDDYMIDGTYHTLLNELQPS